MDKGKLAMIAATVVLSAMSSGCSRGMGQIQAVNNLVGNSQTDIASPSQGPAPAVSSFPNIIMLDIRDLSISEKGGPFFATLEFQPDSETTIVSTSMTLNGQPTPTMAMNGMIDRLPPNVLLEWYDTGHQSMPQLKPGDVIVISAVNNYGVEYQLTTTCSMVTNGISQEIHCN